MKPLLDIHILENEIRIYPADSFKKNGPQIIELKIKILCTPSQLKNIKTSKK